MTSIISRAGDTVDAICYRHYGKTASVTEAVYASNAGLAEKGLILPPGISISLPEVQAETTQKSVNLWD